MPYIKVDVDKIREYQQEATKIRNAIRTISNDFSYIAGYLDSNVKSSGGIRGKLYNVESSLSDHRSVLFNVNTFLSNAAMKYGVVEKTLYTRDRASGDATYTDVDAMTKAIAAKYSLSINAVKEVVISGKYSIDEMREYADGTLTEGAFLTSIKEVENTTDEPGVMVGKRKTVGAAVEEEEAAVAAGSKISSAIGSAAGVMAMEVASVVESADGIVAVGTMTATVGSVSGTVSTSDTELSKEEEKAAISLLAKAMGVDESDIQESIDSGELSTKDLMTLTSGGIVKASEWVEKICKKAKKAVGAEKLKFVTKDGYVVLSGFTRDGKLNELVQKAQDGTGLGTRYKVDTLKDTPVVGDVYKMDKIQKTAQGVAAVATAVSGAITAVDKVQNVLKDDSLSDKEKAYDTSAVVLTSLVGTALAVGAPFAGEAVEGAVTAAFTAAFPGAGTVVGKAVGIVAGKAVEKGMELVSEVVMSEAVVEQVSESLEKVGDAVSSGVAAVSDAGKKLLESKNVGDAVKNTGELVGKAAIAGVTVVGTALVENAKVGIAIAKETVKTAAQKVEKKVEEISEAAKKAAEATKKAAEAAKKAAEEAARKAAEEIARKAAEAKRAAEEAARKAAEEIARKAAAAKKAAEEAARKAAEAARKAAEAAKRAAEEAARKAAEAAKKTVNAVKKILKKW